MPYAKACSRHEQPIAMQSYDKYFRKTTRFVIIFLGLVEGRGLTRRAQRGWERMEVEGGEGGGAGVIYRGSGCG